jgi:hypothetical protein
VEEALSIFFSVVRGTVLQAWDFGAVIKPISRRPLGIRLAVELNHTGDPVASAPPRPSPRKSGKGVAGDLVTLKLNSRLTMHQLNLAAAHVISQKLLSRTHGDS